MLKVIFPRQENFFTLFSQASKELVKAAHEFNKLLHDLSEASVYAQMIATYERNADVIAKTTFEYLHKTFITPFDRSDIQQITIKLDDILDSINGLAQRISVYQLTNLPPEICSLGGLCIRLSELVDKSLSLITSLKNSDEILACCEEIEQIKNEGDSTLISGLAHLFHTENDIKCLLKIKDIYEHAKLVIENYEDLAHVIKSIIFEYS